MRVVSAGGRYREIEVFGTPREMGRQLGEAVREEIRGFVAIAVERVNKTAPITREQALATASACIPYVADYAPELLAELRGMAASSGVSLDELMLLQVRNQLRSRKDAGRSGGGEAQVGDDGGCTALAVRRPALVAQNWDNDPALDPFTVVLTRRPLIAPATLTVGQAGLIGYIGCSDRGIGVCLNALPAPARDVGVPHYFIVRRVLEAGSLDAAMEAVRSAYRAIPANLILATPQGPPTSRSWSTMRAAAGGGRRLADAHQPLSASGADRRQRAVSGADRVGPPQAPGRRPSGAGGGRHRCRRSAVGATRSPGRAPLDLPARQRPPPARLLDQRAVGGH